MYQKLFSHLMSNEQPEEADQNEDFPLQPPKLLNQNTTTCFKGKNNAHSAIFDFESQLQSSTDCSFELGIHKENMEILKNATVRYLQDSLVEVFNKSEGFKDKNLYDNLPFQMGGHSQLEQLTMYNQHLSIREKQQLHKILKEEEELLNLFRQITPVFGITVGKQLVFAILQILQLKLNSFKQITNPQSSFLPRFNCFQGYEEEQNIFQTSCPIYQEINLDEIPHFAEKQLEDLGSTLFNSCQIKYLNLREIKSDTKGNILHKFHLLVNQLSKTVFFTLIGAIQPANMTGSTIFALDLSREVSFSDFPEGNILSIQRSMSRPFVPCEEEQLDFLSKKLKFE